MIAKSTDEGPLTHGPSHPRGRGESFSYDYTLLGNTGEFDSDGAFAPSGERVAHSAG